MPTTTASLSRSPWLLPVARGGTGSGACPYLSHGARVHCVMRVEATS